MDDPQSTSEFSNSDDPPQWRRSRILLRFSFKTFIAAQAFAQEPFFGARL
jgi:hypothetical protein